MEPKNKIILSILKLINHHFNNFATLASETPKSIHQQLFKTLLRLK